MRTPSDCPVCGEDLPPKARSCPHCGADERTGWNEEATRYDGADIPVTAFDDEEDPDPPRGRGPRPAGLHPAWWLIAAGLALFFLWNLVAPFL